MTAKAAPPDLLAAAFELIAEQGWDQFSPAELGRRAGVPMIEVVAVLPSRRSLIGLLARRLDHAMLTIDPQDLEGLLARDRVFELMMCRLESLVPFRPGLERLARAGRGDPCLLLAAGCRLDRSLIWLQDAAGLRCHGLRARVARRALAVAYLSALRVWFGDEGADLGKTMAELDKQLRRIEAIAGLREPRTGKAGSSPTTDEAAPQPA